ncbi:hypothetical protein LCGC14_2647960, partial [marine sediment metagenome]
MRPDLHGAVQSGLFAALSWRRFCDDTRTRIDACSCIMRTRDYERAMKGGTMSA